MAREITPNSIRETGLKRRFRGYDPHETEQLLADVAESLERVSRDRRSLSEHVEGLQRELREGERAFKSELDRLNEELAAREQRLSELEGEVIRLQEGRSTHMEEADRLTEELSGTKAALEEHQAALTELQETVARFETREKALAEQIAMLESQLEHAQETDRITEGPQALPHLENRAATTLLLLDRAVETVEREAREEAETILKQAQEQAEEILRSAEAQRRIESETARPDTSDHGREEYDPVASLERVEGPASGSHATGGAEQEIGEAAWTAGRNPDHLPERNS
jgi:cell division septum initiation protein DivIVA